VGKEVKRKEFYQTGIKAINYSLEAQNRDGSFYYRELIDGESNNIHEPRRRIDHYHTGFVLRSLHSIYRITNDERARGALSKGYQFYTDNMFEDETIPKMTPQSVYPINIHSCAESILCMSSLSDIFPNSLGYARRAFRWTRKNMQDKDGHFYYLRTRSSISKIPYIRWSQAWMMRALAALLVTIQ
jgi:rhamnogalacturonyl hydrolase YesR